MSSQRGSCTVLIGVPCPVPDAMLMPPSLYDRPDLLSDARLGTTGLAVLGNMPRRAGSYRNVLWRQEKPQHVMQDEGFGLGEWRAAFQSILQSRARCSVLFAQFQTKLARCSPRYVISPTCHFEHVLPEGVRCPGSSYHFGIPSKLPNRAIDITSNFSRDGLRLFVGSSVWFLLSDAPSESACNYPLAHFLAGPWFAYR